MKLLDIYYETRLDEANLKSLHSKSVNETPKMASRGKQLYNRVRYFGLSKDGTLNFKIGSQSFPGKFYYAYIEAPDILKFGDIVENGDHFTKNDLAKLLTMNGFRIHCSDPSFLYWSFQYMATRGNYEIEPETRAPKRNNTTLAGALCKHLIATVDNLYTNDKMREAISKDIDNYLRMLAGFDYDDYQQLNHARQIKQQNRAVKWKDKPSDYMNDYFALQAKHHPFLDDHDIKKSLKKEITKFARTNPNSSVDDFLRSYFSMTEKAFAEDMGVPETSIEDYFNELGFEDKKNKQLAKLNNKEDKTKASILTKDSENLNESYLFAKDVTSKELSSNEVKFVTYGNSGRHENVFNNLTELFKYIDQCGGFRSFKGIMWSIVSEYKGSEFYYVRDSFAKGGWKWEDANGDPVEYEYSKRYRDALGESNYLTKLDPQVEDTEQDRKGIDYYKEQISKGNHRPILINEDLDILDGNHTMTAYQELNIEPPLVYQGSRKDFYSYAWEAKGDARKAIDLMIEDGVAKKLTESDKVKEYLTPKEAHEKYQEYLTGHIGNVIDAVDLIIECNKDNNFIQEEAETLKNIAKEHDESKYEEAEYIPYLHHFYPTKPEEENLTEEFELACKHHILSNKHHWDFWIDPQTLELRDIPDDDREYKLYCVERVADWLAMAKQHDEDKNIWYESNKKSMKMPEWAFKFIDEIYSNIPDDYYLNLKFGGTRGPLDESEDNAEFDDSIDKGDVYVHTNRGITSRFPALGKGYYLFNAKSVAPEINQPVQNKNNRYYLIKNASNLYVFDSIDESADTLPASVFSNIDLEGSISIGRFLRRLSSKLGDEIVEFMKSNGVDGIQIIDDANLYSEPVTHETIIYNMDILEEINPIN